MGVELGIWSQRYVLLAEDGVVKVLNLKEGGKITNSNAEDMLSISRRVAYSPISRHSTSPTSGTTSTWEAACAHEAFNFFSMSFLCNDSTC
jgi:hypothetical protein